MIVSAMQPGYLPWLGFFELMERADIFVIYDDVDYDKGSWRNRNRIRTPTGASWITVPVITKNHFGQKIRDVMISVGSRWKEKHLRTIIQNYRRAKSFEVYIPIFEKIYSQKWEWLIDIDMVFIEELRVILGIQKKMVTSSSLQLQGKKTDRLISLCQELAATHYISSAGAKPYLEIGKFQRVGIQVEFQSYSHPVYPQVYEGFVSHLSVIDLIFNCGQESRDTLMSGSGSNQPRV